GSTPQIGRYDASYGTLLTGNGAGGFTPLDSSGYTPLDGSYPTGFTSMPMRNSGLTLTGQVRDMVSLTYRNKQEIIIFAKNDDRIQVYEVMVR
ncbi:MAG: hypothetical protein ACE5IR_26455, partial [bacterium]